MNAGGEGLSNYGPDDVQNMGRSVFLGDDPSRPLSMSAMMKENHFDNR